MSADCGKLKNSNCFRHAHKGDFPKFGHILYLSLQIVQLTYYTHRFPSPFQFSSQLLQPTSRSLYD